MQRPLSVGSEIDDQFDALAHPVRRRLLLELYRERPLSDGGVAVDDDPHAVDPVDFHHTHLPKLRELGYVRYDEADERLEPGPDFDDVEWLLSELAERTAAGNLH